LKHSKIFNFLPLPLPKDQPTFHPSTCVCHIPKLRLAKENSLKTFADLFHKAVSRLRHCVFKNESFVLSKKVTLRAFLVELWSHPSYLLGTEF
jgi:hypothetical protein